MIRLHKNPMKGEPYREVLKRYDPQGIRVKFDMYGIAATGTIIRQWLGGMRAEAYFAVKLDPAFVIPFSELAEVARIRAEGPEGRERALRAIYFDFQNLRCLDEKDNIVCYWSLWGTTEVIEFQKGMPVEYVEPGTHIASIKSTPGIVTRVHRKPAEYSYDVVELFLTSPLSWTRAPEAMPTDFIRPDQMSSLSYGMIVRSTYLKWKEVSPETLPPGQMSEDGVEYLFENPVPMEEIKKFCDSHVEPDELKTRCWIGAAYFHIIPILNDPAYGVFRPMRQETAGAEAVQMISPEQIELLRRLKEVAPDIFPIQHTLTWEEIEEEIRRRERGE